LHCVVPFRDQFQVQPTGIMRGRFDGAVEIEFLGGSLAGKLAQAAQRQLDVAGAQFDGVVEIAELTPIPDFDGAAVAPLLLTDAHSLGVVPMGAKRRSSGGADPFAAALVPRLLLGEPLAQSLHQLFPAASRLDQPFLLLRQEALGELSQPFLRYLRLGIRQGLDALEAMPEYAVEAVEMALVLDQRGAREKVELVDVESRHAL